PTSCSLRNGCLGSTPGARAAASSRPQRPPKAEHQPCARRALPATDPEKPCTPTPHRQQAAPDPCPAACLCSGWPPASQPLVPPAPKSSSPTQPALLPMNKASPPNWPRPSSSTPSKSSNTPPSCSNTSSCCPAWAA